MLIVRTVQFAISEPKITSISIFRQIIFWFETFRMSSQVGKISKDAW